MGTIVSAIILARTNGLDPEHFAVGFWGGLSVLAVVGILALIARLRSPRAGNTHRKGWFARHPVAVSAIALAVLTPLMVAAAWNPSSTTAPTKLAALSVLASWMFLVVVGFVFVIRSSIRLLSKFVRWAMGAPYRAGFFAGVAALFLARFLGAAGAAPDVDQDRFVERATEVLDDVSDTSPTDATRYVLAAIAGHFLGPIRDYARVSGRRAGNTAEVAEPTPERERNRVPVGFHECMERLRSGERVDKLRRELMSYSLGRYDVDDILSEALLRTCLRLDRVNKDLTGYFVRTAHNEAKRQLHRWDPCRPNDEAEADAPPTIQCDVQEDEEKRYSRQMAAIDEQLCRLDADRRRIIELHIGHERSFAEIADELGMERGKVRNSYYDAIKRIRLHLKKTGCELG
jgi:RNA polymerase sigma factor (sigma-70 family)